MVGSSYAVVVAAARVQVARLHQRPTIARGTGHIYQRGRTSTAIRSRNLSEADGCFVAYAAHELRGEIILQLTLA